jgi:hypothetical protein
MIEEPQAPEPQTSDWSPGDTALITDSEYSGTYARIWEVNAARNMAVVSLPVFRDHIPFEIELSSLRKPPSPLRHLFKAICLGAVTAVASPLMFLLLLFAVDLFLPHHPPAFLSRDVVAHTISLPLIVGVSFGIYVGIRVLTDPESQD